MTAHTQLVRDESGAAAIETAFALPILIMMIWAILQFGLVFRAQAGIQQALGEGARYATLCLNPGTSGCSSPTADEIKARITQSVYGIGPGTFTVDDPLPSPTGTAKYFDLTVRYSQPTSLLLVPGPTIAISRSKRVWIAAA
jgi:Flp pilus assembly protein TadG